MASAPAAGRTTGACLAAKPSPFVPARPLPEAINNVKAVELHAFPGGIASLKRLNQA